MKRKPILREEDISPGFRCPDDIRLIAMPLCGVCRNWDGYGKCKKLGKSPDVYRESEKRDCPDAVLATERPGFQEFSELYPEDTKKLLERQKGSQDDQDHP